MPYVADSNEGYDSCTAHEYTKLEQSNEVGFRGHGNFWFTCLLGTTWAGSNLFASAQHVSWEMDRIIDVPMTKLDPKSTIGSCLAGDILVQLQAQSRTLLSQGYLLVGWSLGVPMLRVHH